MAEPTPRVPADVAADAEVEQPQGACGHPAGLRPDDLIEALDTAARRRDAGYAGDAGGTKAHEVGSVRDGILGELVMYAIAGVFVWKVTQPWSWLVPATGGVLLMFGIPAYVLLRRR